MDFMINASVTLCQEKGDGREEDGAVVLCNNVRWKSTIGRVAAGSYPPAAPTDPGVPHSGTRLLR